MNPNLDPHVARDMFVGTMEHLVTRWLLKDRAYPLFDKLEFVFDLMLNGFLAAKENKEAAADRGESK